MAQELTVDGIASHAHDDAEQPMRVNKAVELLEQRQPVYFEFVDGESAGEYDGGRALAQTWADYITYDMEHSALDVRGADCSSCAASSTAARPGADTGHPP